MENNKIELFLDYPDVVSLEDMRIMLGSKNKKLGRTTAYKLLQEKKIFSKKVAREYKIPKQSIINYLLNTTNSKI